MNIEKAQLPPRGMTAHMALALFAALFLSGCASAPPPPSPATGQAAVNAVPKESAAVTPADRFRRRARPGAKGNP